MIFEKFTYVDKIFSKFALSSIKQHRAGKLHSAVITLLICTLLPQTEPQWGETGNCKCSSWNIMSRKRVIKSSDRAQWSRSIWKFSDKWRVRFFLPPLVTVWQTQRLNLPLSQAMSNSTLQECLSLPIKSLNVYLRNLPIPRTSSVGLCYPLLLFIWQKRKINFLPLMVTPWQIQQLNLPSLVHKYRSTVVCPTCFIDRRT